MIRTGARSPGNAGVLLFGRFDVLHRADPAARSEIEHEPVRVAVLHFVVAVLRFRRSPVHVLGAGFDRLLLRGLEVVHPHAEVDEAVERLVAFDTGDLRALVVEQRDVHDAVGHVDTAAGVARLPHAEGFLEELLRFGDVRYRYRDVPQLVLHLPHGAPSFYVDTGVSAPPVPSATNDTLSRRPRP